MQEQIKKDQESTPLVMDKSELERIQATPTTRVVILKSESCCGCGCSDIKVKRTVPYDSPLKDGDYLKPKDISRSDKVIWD